MRKHVSDLAWLTFAALFVLLFAFDAKAAVPRLLPIANNGQYATSVIAENKTSAPVQWALTQNGCYPLPSVSIAANGAAVRKTAGDFCSDIVLVDPGNASARSIIRFSDGKSASSYVVPPIGAVTIEAPSVIGPVINDAETGSYITFIASEKSAVTVTIYDGARQVIGTETYDVPVGASQFKPKTKFAVGFVSIALGFSQFGIYPSKAPLYGFVSVSRADTSNAIIYPFGQ